MNTIDGSPLPIRSVNINDGLSNSSVNCIFQDHFGFIWIGTHDGLNCYDGKRFITFRNRFGSQHSLPYNYIYAIAEDKKSRIWVATGQGVGIYDRLTKEFKDPVCVSYDGKAFFKNTSSVNTLKLSAQGDMLIGTNGLGLMIQAQNDTILRQVPCRAKDGRVLLNYNVRSIVTDPNGQIWVGVEAVGLCKYLPQFKKLLTILPNFQSINCLQADGPNIWLGTRKGLYCYNKNQNKIFEPINDFYSAIGKEDISSVLIVNHSKIWLGTTGNGLFTINLKTKDVQHYVPGKDGANSISSETIVDIMQDFERRIWIATEKGGINIIDRRSLPFHTISRDPLTSNTLVYPYISSFNEDYNGNLWIGTDGGGLSIWQPDKKKYLSYSKVSNDPTSLSSNLISSIITDFTHTTWVATYGGGINCQINHSGKFKKYKCITPDNQENNYLWLLYEDHTRNLWATTFIGGYIYYLDRKADKFKIFDRSINNIVAFMEDQKHDLWAGNALNLIKIDRYNGKHLYYKLGKPIRAIYEDKRKNFWIGTEAGGLILFDRATGKILKQYTDANGLCNNSVINILEDDHGNLWLSTFNGLACFNPFKQKFRNFFHEDGLQSNQFSYNAALKLKSGEMLFGGIGGFTRFYPDSIQFAVKKQAAIYLETIKIDNQSLTSNSRFVKGTNGIGINAIEVPFQNANLSVTFSAIDFTGTANARFSYYLENWDRRWSYTPNADAANYSHLNEGIYYLHVKRADIAGNWGQDKVLLKVIVLPPFYRSDIAFLLYATIICAIIYLYNRYRTGKARLQHEVEMANASAEKEKELNEKKTAFFTNISHEFRTPVTLIINPLKDYLQKHASKNESENLEIVYLNARKLLSLTDQLLNFKKAESNTDKLELTNLNFAALCQDVHNSFLTEAKMKNIKYAITNNISDGTVCADRNKLEAVISNLYANAIKYTPNHGTVHITINETGEELTFEIKDTGPGVPADLGDKLYEKFFRSNMAETATQPGFGIGLYLVKNYVEAHKGILSYHSIEGKGTSFCVKLKKNVDGFAQSKTTVDNNIFEPHLSVPEDNSDEYNKIDDWIDSRQIIIVVEDNKQLREYIVDLFDEEYLVYSASDGEKGYQHVLKYSPDLVITDIVMEIKNGIDLCAQLKSDPALSHIPVILLTAIADTPMRLKAAETGADDYVTKPFEKELLIARVKSLLQNRNKLQQYFYNEVTLKKQDLKVPIEYQSFLQKCITIVNEHIDDEDFNIHKFTLEIGLSRSNLYRKVKLVSGLSITGFIRYIRLRKAAELMVNTTMTINEISFHVGMQDVKYFRKQFNILFGVNPSDYIKKYRASFLSRKHHDA